MGLYAINTAATNVRVWDTDTWLVEHDLAVTQRSYSIRFSWDNASFIYGPSSGAIDRYDVATWSLQTIEPLPFGNAYSLAVSPNGQWLAAGGDNGRVFIYETTNWTVIQQLYPISDTGFIWDIEFSRDSSLMAVARNTGTASNALMVFDTSTWTLVPGAPTGSVAQGLGVSFNGDGSILAVSYNNSPYLELWNTSTWTKLPDPSTMPTAGGYDVTFSWDGSLMAFAQNGAPRVQVYDTSDWSRLSVPVNQPSSGACWDITWAGNDEYLGVPVRAANQSRVYDTSDWSVVSGGGGSGYNLIQSACFTNPTLVPPAEVENPVIVGINF